MRIAEPESGASLRVALESPKDGPPSRLEALVGGTPPSSYLMLRVTQLVVQGSSIRGRDFLIPFMEDIASPVDLDLHQRGRVNRANQLIVDLWELPQRLQRDCDALVTDCTEPQMFLAVVDGLNGELHHRRRVVHQKSLGSQKPAHFPENLKPFLFGRRDWEAVLAYECPRLLLGLQVLVQAVLVGCGASSASCRLPERDGKRVPQGT